MKMKTKEILKSFNEIISAYLSESDIKSYNSILDEAWKDKPDAISYKFEKEKVDDYQLSQYRRFQLESIITLAESKLDKSSFIDMLLNLGDTTLGLGEQQFAFELYKSVIIKIEKDSPFQAYKAYALLSMGEIKARQAVWKEALDYLKKAKKLFIDQRDVVNQARVENIVGSIYGDLGDLQKAKKHFAAGLSLLETSKNKYLTAQLEGNLAVINLAMHDYDMALSNLRRALNRFEQISDPRGITQARYNIGLCLLKKGELDDALKELDSSLDKSFDKEYLVEVNLAYLTKAAVYTEKGDFRLSMALADHSMDLSYKIQDKLTIADIFKVKGVICRKMGKNSLAENYLMTSLRMNKDLENSYNYSETSVELGILYKEQKEVDKAKPYLLDAIQFNKKIGAESEVNRIKQLIAN
jgi:tetratricopeptide (TPR) repeat protein